ncbi:MAG: hypothetical protein AABX71_02055 [Nanoarchaeota archaeon]
MKISDKKKDRISEQILAFLYSVSPKPVFTFHIAMEVARDEEFVKNLLLELREKNLITEIRKNPEGKPYLKRSRWRLSDAAYNAYRSAGNQENKPIADKTYIKTD